MRAPDALRHDCLSCHHVDLFLIIIIIGCTLDYIALYLQSKGAAVVVQQKHRLFHDHDDDADEREGTETPRVASISEWDPRDHPSERS